MEPWVVALGLTWQAFIPITVAHNVDQHVVRLSECVYFMLYAVACTYTFLGIALPTQC
jgi:hypothetical protein